jgi:hypothetical protein
MAMKNYKVTQTDGTTTFYQFDDSTDEGKAGLGALQRAAKDSDNPVASVEPGEPVPFNKAAK